ncbi:MAG: response regulator [Acidobacteriota bacterium]|nr:response regulator [Acidobacteriota bacterium]
MGSTILVVDAEPVVRTVVTSILEREGHTVHATADVGEAVRIVKTKSPDLLLTNVLLPGMRGHDAAELLRGIRPEMRVLMVAGLPDDQEIYDMTEGDGIEPFPKPFTAQELAAKVREVLGRSPQQARTIGQ